MTALAADAVVARHEMRRIVPRILSDLQEELAGLVGVPGLELVVLAKLGVRDRTRAVLKALELGLV